MEMNRATANLRDNTKTSNICITGVSEGEEKECTTKEERMAENFHIW